MLSGTALQYKYNNWWEPNYGCDHETYNIYNVTNFWKTHNLHIKQLEYLTTPSHNLI